ncbi:MAG: hypothetical protein IBX57_00450 [Gammaproteobacteria bacterium]|nr:hypothetical protein [Gammaproteobacteria bacterium]
MSPFNDLCTIAMEHSRGTITVKHNLDEETKSKVKKVLRKLQDFWGEGIYKYTEEDYLTGYEANVCWSENLYTKAKVIEDFEDAYGIIYPDEEIKRTNLRQYMEIIGVAVKHKDLVIALPKPNRHHDVILHLVDVLGVTPPVGHDGQGFYLEDGTYLDREEARIHALTTGQVKTTITGVDLFSEDLW